LRPCTTACQNECWTFVVSYTESTGEQARVGAALPDQKAKDWAVEKGCYPDFGARPLKRFQQHQIEPALARALISGEVADGSLVVFSVKDDALV